LCNDRQRIRTTRHSLAITKLLDALIERKGHF
jgi:hypothetical protein